MLRGSKAQNQGKGPGGVGGGNTYFRENKLTVIKETSLLKAMHKCRIMNRAVWFGVGGGHWFWIHINMNINFESLSLCLMCNMCNDDRNIDHRRWSKRCLLTRGNQTLKKNTCTYEELKSFTGRYMPALTTTPFHHPRFVSSGGPLLQRCPPPQLIGEKLFRH